MKLYTVLALLSLLALRGCSGADDVVRETGEAIVKISRKEADDIRLAAKAVPESSMEDVRSINLADEIGRISDFKHIIEGEVDKVAAHYRNKDGALAREKDLAVHDWIKSTACLYLDKSLKGQEPTDKDLKEHFEKLVLKHRLYIAFEQMKEKGETISRRLEMLAKEKDLKKGSYVLAITTYCEVMK